MWLLLLLASAAAPDREEVRRNKGAASSPTASAPPSGARAAREEERRKGFVKPVRRSYVHRKCGSVTTMGVALSETFARDPHFYSGTFCVACRAHFPVGDKVGT